MRNNPTQEATCFSVTIASFPHQSLRFWRRTISSCTLELHQCEVDFHIRVVHCLFSLQCRLLVYTFPSSRTKSWFQTHETYEAGWYWGGRCCVSLCHCLDQGTLVKIEKLWWYNIQGVSFNFSALKMTKCKEKWCETLCCSGTGVSIPQRSWFWLRFSSIVLIFFLFGSTLRTDMW